MKKSKLLLVSVLSVVLCIVCVMSSASTTFSWFTRPRTLTGDKLQLPGKTYEIANGKNISFATYESTDGGANYGSTPVTNFSADVAPHKRKMYRTDVTNSGNDPQSISLFLNNVNIGEGEGKFYLGVNSPLKTFKPYGSNTSSSEIVGTKTNNSTMRVYFQPKDINNDWKNQTYVIHYGNGNTNSALDMEATGTSGTYFKDIPTTTTQVYFSVKNSSESWKRTQTFTNVQGDGLSATNSLVFWLTGTFDSWSGGNNNAQADKAKVNGANIITYYKKITLTVGQEFSAALTEGTDYIGNIKYYDDDSHLDIMTANEETGLITAKKVGTSKLYTKVTGSAYGDSMQVETEVEVVAVSTVGSNTCPVVPVVTNVRVAGASTEGTSVESIFWYIKNDSDTTLSYTIGSLDLTL